MKRKIIQCVDTGIFTREYSRQGADSSPIRVYSTFQLATHVQDARLRARRAQLLLQELPKARGQHPPYVGKM